MFGKAIGLCLFGLICNGTRIDGATGFRTRSYFTPGARNLDISEAAPFAAAFSQIAFCTASHDVGRLSLLMTNGGIIGAGDLPARGQFSAALTPYPYDSAGCYLGSIPSQSEFYAGEYPLGSGNKCLEIGSLWVGGITADGDTLVSTGWDSQAEQDEEFYADLAPLGNIAHYSLLDQAGAAEARSDQDYLAVYTDTFVQGLSGLKIDWTSHKRHQPLGIRVTQQSSEWSNSSVNNFVLIEFTIENIGRRDLRDVFAGLYLQPGFEHVQPDGTMPDDDLTGYLRAFPSAQGCGFEDTLNLAWAADNNGNPDNTKTPPVWVESGLNQSVRDITGIRVLEAPSGADQISFNWWTVGYGDPVYDYGPRHRARVGSWPRDFGAGGTGNPMGDANKYYVMSNGEIDPDQPRIRQIQMADTLWEYPSDFARQSFYAGFHIANLTSVGPFQLRVGEAKSIVFAFVGGTNFHTDPDNGHRLARGDVDGWYAHVDFSSLAKNAKIAEWTFDNPGVDTDGDGYRGKFRVCVLDSTFENGRWVPTNADTTYYTGDGVPGLAGAGTTPTTQVLALTGISRNSCAVQWKKQ